VPQKPRLGCRALVEGTKAVELRQQPTLTGGKSEARPPEFLAPASSRLEDDAPGTVLVSRPRCYSRRRSIHGPLTSRGDFEHVVMVAARRSAF